jgi:hypothetical protein
LYEATKEAHGGLTISPALPGLITSTDDSTLYHCVEKNNGFVEFVLVKGPTGTRGAFTHDEASSFNGVRIRIRAMMAADRTMAPIVLYLTGLTEQELPQASCPSGIYEIPIPGLSYGGSVDPCNELPKS